MIENKVYISLNGYYALSNTEIINWIIDYSNNYTWAGGEFDDVPVGVYLNYEDAILLKLKFNL